MSSCARRRWGPGTTCERPIVTEKTKELDDKLKERMAERERQSNFWNEAPTQSVSNNGTAAPQPKQALRFNN